MKKLRYTILLLSLLPLMALAALPLSRSTTYVAGTTPVIKAADLNGLQDYLSDLYANLRSVKGVTIDATGGGLPVAPNGGLAMTATAANTTLPATNVPTGTFVRESALAGAGYFDAACASNGTQFNTQSCGVLLNVYTVTFNVVPISASRCVPWAIARSTTAVLMPMVHNTGLDGSNRMQVLVRFVDTAGTATATAFYVGIFCG